MGVAVDDSWGYEGLIAPNDVWARMQYGLGCRYWVKQPFDCAVTAKSNGTRQVNIATGYMGGWGVVDHISTTKVLDLPIVASGTAYFMIVARRIWGTTQQTTIDYIGPTTDPTLLPARNMDGDNPSGGGKDDQPLALVSLRANDTIPTVVADLRAIGTSDRGTVMALSDLALQYLNYAGQQVRTPTGLWTRVADNASGGRWEQDPTITKSIPGGSNDLRIGGYSGWYTVAELESWGSASGRGLVNRHLRLQARRSGADLQFSSTLGSVAGGDQPVMHIDNTDWRPPYSITALCKYWGSTGASFGGHCTIDAGGVVTLISGQPGTNVGHKTTGVSFQVEFSWIKGF